VSPEPPRPPAKPAPALYCLKLGDHAVQIADDGLVIGRSPSCDVAINDSQVSRRHARLWIAKGRPTIEDLGSANGVYVNGERLKGPRALEVGDILVIGASRFELATGSAMERNLDSTGGRQAITADDLPVSRHSARRAQGADAPGAAQDPPLPRLYVDDSEADSLDEFPSSEHTRRADVLVLFGQVAGKMLAAGQAHAAEQLLRPRLREVLAEIKSGTRDAGELAEIAAGHAVRLAGAAGSAEWVDYVFELYGAAARPPPLRIVDELHTVIRKVPRIRVEVLREYIGMLSKRSHRLTPAERFVLQRLQGLVRLAETK